MFLYLFASRYLLMKWLIKRIAVLEVISRFFHCMYFLFVIGIRVVIVIFQNMLVLFTLIT